MSYQSAVLEYAKRYASSGFRVIPVPFQAKAPIVKGWPARASTNHDDLELWFGAGTPSNLGLVMGNGIVALDVDVKSGGPSTLAALETQNGALPITPTQKTGSGGLHYIFRIPPLGDIKIGNRTAFLPGLDLKSDKGQIIAEPSINDKGGAYKWLPGLAPWDTDVAEIPNWLLMSVLSQPRLSAQHVPGTVGSRNVTLHRAGSRLRGRGGEEIEIAAALTQMNAEFAIPLDRQEVDGVIRSVMKYPRGVPAYVWNDSGNALRFVDEHECVLRFAADEKIWLIWNGKCWAADNKGSVTVMFKDMVEAMRIEAKEIDASTTEGKKLQKAAISWARGCGNASRISAGLKLAESDPRIVVQLAACDDLPGLLPVDNGVIELGTGALLPHEPKRLVTKVAPVRYDAGAVAPRWKAILDFAVPGDLGEFVQTYLGYALTGTPVEQRFVVFKGEGGNGKSVIANVVANVLGPFVTHTTAETFLAVDNANKGGTRADLLALRGARLVIASEVPSRRKLDALTIKSVAGGEPIVARGLYSRSPTTFPVTFTVLALTNPYPGADEGDGGLWRRLLLTPFDRIVPAQQINRTLAQDIIREEPEGVLAWLVAGARRYIQRGLQVPAEIEGRTRLWRREVGSMERFMSARCETTRCEQKPVIPLKALHDEYRHWCQCNQMHFYGLETLKIRLLELGYLISQEGAREFVNTLRSGVA